MFVAWRDLRFARGRFALIGAVVALITVLVGFLSGLTGGLAQQNVSGVLSMPTDRIVFAQTSDGSAPTFADSTISTRQLQQWRETPGVTSVQPVGISQSRAEAGDTRTAVSLWGVAPGYAPSAPSAPGQVSLSEPAAKALGVGTGARIDIAGKTYMVGSITGDDWYSHTPVVFMTMTDWSAMPGSTGAPTVLAVKGDPDWSAVDRAAATVSKTPLAALTALSTFRSEIGSLLMMVVLLVGISALVVGAFFTVWTMQRRGDVAVLKALGASTASLARDALGQALVVLLAGTAIGIAVVVAGGLAAGSALPFVLSPLTTALPAAVMVVVGLAGAAVALRSITSADPLTALGSNR